MLFPAGTTPLHLDFDDDAGLKSWLEWVSFFVGLSISVAIGAGLYIALT